jgi:hypothetical protein
MSSHRFVFLNTSIITSFGLFRLSPITGDVVRTLLANHPDVERLSAIGHEATAKIMSSILGEEILVNRIEYKQEFNDLVVCFKLHSRIPEGTILTEQEIAKIGYEFMILEKVGPEMEHPMQHTMDTPLRVLSQERPE